jgi:hypothetical protein
MSTEVDICNLALANLGDTATVASLNPPEGSAQAEHCARFYPMARNALLEMHPWGFATHRVRLALLGNPWAQWRYAYAQPADVLNLLAVLPPDAADDYSIDLPQANFGRRPANAVAYTPQPFSCEVNAAGAQIILTNQADAALRYTAVVTDTSKFSPLFTVALSWHLASMLAGPILKGDAGAKQAQICAKTALAYLSQAKESDANQRRVSVQQNVPWIAGR